MSAHGRLYDVQGQDFNQDFYFFQTNFGPGLYKIANVANGPIGLGMLEEPRDDIPVVSTHQAVVVGDVESFVAISMTS